MEIVKKYGKPPCWFKAQVSSAEYEGLIKGYNPTDIKEMVYFYFDTDLDSREAKFLSSRVRLRIRLGRRKHVLELKNRPASDISQIISFSELNSVFQGVVPNGPVKDRLTQLNLPNLVLLIGTAHTIRAKKLFHDGTLVLDQTVNAGQAHYQIEFRSDKSFSDREIQTIKDGLGLAGGDVEISKIRRVWLK
jgi:uncharacterized protein YjbK